MKRRLLNALAVLSLILALATGVLWVRSYRAFDGIPNDEGTTYCVGSLRGRLAFSLRGDVWPSIREWEWHTMTATDDVDWAVGIGYVYFSHTIIAFPHWSLLTVCLILPSLRGWQLLRARKRQKENLCPTCGYDLRAHRAGDRCPECGQSPKPPAPAASASHGSDVF